ncbi:putative HTH-type transcriptional regulator [Flagellimonas maritima]|uniref:Putative HTH-type transcriptional regulator n=1 Tax=Flagellimonas maritima TaxID=1383885 RepID=A0A2Z4LUH4_9FLAO|nr:Lrp/AsnC family transcriptional regulator [Allomuricauda aurantiaca]AWX45555.1 putative HTH-type transcriptional regulator [Allomuricauda aurantiaca]
MSENLFQLDAFDQSLIQLLKKDGRMSFTDVASALNVSVSTVRNRYNKLVDEGMLHILGWVDPTKTGFNSYNRVTIEVSPSSMIEYVAQELMKVKEISFLALTSGPSDIEINLICRDNRHLLEVMKKKIFNIKGVRNTNSTIYYNVYKWAEHDLELPTKNILLQEDMD